MGARKKVVVLGVLGMAGHIMYDYLASCEEYEVLGVAREVGRNVDKVFDIIDFEILGAYLAEVNPDYVINCVGVLVSESQNDIARAILINSYLPHYLSEHGRKLSYKLVHISTDCVFSGKDGLYKEESFRDGDDNYARTKALGEVINQHDLTVRTSIIGPELKINGTGLFDWFIKQENSIRGYVDTFWSGVTTLELAKAVHSAIQSNITGLYHLTNNMAISKYDLLCLFKIETKKVVDIEGVTSKGSNKSFIDTRKELAYIVPSYEVMVKDMLEQMRTNKQLYPHYNFC